MYIREVINPPKHIINHGVPVFGTFHSPPATLDIRGARRPFGNFLLPAFLTNLRVRSTVRFYFDTTDYIGIIDISATYVFGFAEITLWNKNSGQKYAYRRLGFSQQVKIPNRIDDATTSFCSKKRRVCIRWSTSKKRISADFILKGDTVRPLVKGGFALHLDDELMAQIALVLPQRVSRRCSASWLVSAPAKGALTIGEKTEKIQAHTSFFDISKAYYSWRTEENKLVGFGEIGGKHIVIRFARSLAADEYRYNENVMFIDNCAHPLPPVRISRPKGLNGVWVVQDTENMVDLTFTPVSISSRKMNAFFLRTEYHTLYGNFDGVLITATGEKIQCKTFAGIGKKLFLRM